MDIRTQRKTLNLFLKYESERRGGQEEKRNEEITKELTLIVLYRGSHIYTKNT